MSNPHRGHLILLMLLKSFQMIPIQLGMSTILACRGSGLAGLELPGSRLGEQPAVDRHSQMRSPKK
jgi:hypothetical protein